MEALRLLNAPGSSPAKSASTSLQRALDDRLMMSEATSLAADLLEQFPHTKAGDGFIGALAAVLLQYPRQASQECADPLRGIARSAEFLTISALVAWLEKRTEPLRQQVAREQRVAEQLRARDEWETREKDPKLLAKCASWLNRTDPVAAQLVADMHAEDEARRAAATQFTIETHRRQLAEFYKAEGIDPARGVSPSLLKQLQGSV